MLPGGHRCGLSFRWMNPLPTPTYLTDSSNSGHNGVLKELKFLASLTEEEVDFIVITVRAAQALRNVG